MVREWEVGALPERVCWRMPFWLDPTAAAAEAAARARRLARSEVRGAPLDRLEITSGSPHGALYGRTCSDRVRNAAGEGRRVRPGAEGAGTGRAGVRFWQQQQQQQQLERVLWAVDLWPPPPPSGATGWR